MNPKLAFVSLWDAGNHNAESGYAYSMRNQLKRRFDVVDVFPLALPGARLWQPICAAYRLGGRYHHRMREPSVLKALARRIEEALKSIKPDVVFAPSSVPMSFVEASCGWAYSTDQLFCDFVDTYIYRPSARFRRLGNDQERRALSRAARASYPSRWAATSAVEHYGADADKIAVIPWGANLPREMSEIDVDAGIAKRPFDACRLVFIGRDWVRKGGDTLVATVAELNRTGFATHATIIGADPKGLDPRQFTVYPFIDKNNREHFAHFASVMLDAHFLFLPSRAEAYGQAFCEAAAFGVPAIGSTVGGIPTIIRDGETGFVRHPRTSPAKFANLIREALASSSRYLAMAREARRDYCERLNWDSFGDRLNDMISALV
jgi:glycosyltransferase involved in cell wall biosynthesis